MKHDFVVKLLNRRTLVEVEIIVSKTSRSDVELVAREFQSTHSIVSIRERK